MPSTNDVLRLAEERGIIRARDLTARGIPHSLLSRLHQQGRLERISRGTYRSPALDSSSHASLAEACSRVPRGVVCLLSALRFHEMGTENPFEVWMAIDVKSRKPRSEHPPLRVVRFSGPALHLGVEEHSTPDGLIRVYSVPKTVVDCFRYRNKIGLDVALEALHRSLRERRATVDEIWGFARKLRISTVVRPYLEASV